MACCFLCIVTCHIYNFLLVGPERVDPLTAFHACSYIGTHSAASDDHAARAGLANSHIHKFTGSMLNQLFRRQLRQREETQSLFCVRTETERKANLLMTKATHKFITTYLKTAIDGNTLIRFGSSSGTHLSLIHRIRSGFTLFSERLHKQVSVRIW